MKLTLADVACYLFGFKLIEPSMWYINSILVYYVVFYLLFKFFSNSTAIKLLMVYPIFYILVCRYIGLGEWWYNTSFCFPIGTFFALNKDKIYKFMVRYYISLVGSCVTGFGAMVIVSFKGLAGDGFIINLISSILFVFLTVLFLLKIQLRSGIFIFLGGISYEIYIIHKQILNTFFKLSGVKAGYSVFIIFTIIAAAICLNQFLKLLRVNKSGKGEVQWSFQKTI